MNEIQAKRARMANLLLSYESRPNGRPEVKLKFEESFSTDPSPRHIRFRQIATLSSA